MAKRYNSGNYEGMDSRRRQEAQDAEMINSNNSAFANMPQEVIFRAYPGYAEGLKEIDSDNFAGVNKQMNEDHAGMRRHMAPKKV